MSDLRLVYVLFLLLYLIIQSSAAPRFPVAKPGCNDTCGNVTIPYPFGIGPGCALNQAYTLVCTPAINDSINGSRPFLRLHNTPEVMEVLEVSLSDQTITINFPVLQTCSIQGPIFDDMTDTHLDGNPFLISRERNKLMLIGCGNVLLSRSDHFSQVLSGCTSMCNSSSIIGCYGINCCEASFPFYLSLYSLRFSVSQNFTSPCAWAFLVDQKWNLESYSPDTWLPRVPVVWAWPLQNLSDIEAIRGCSPQKRSLQLESSSVFTYQCECENLGNATWFYGINPYLDGACKHAMSQIRGRGKETTTIVGATVAAGVLIFMITVFTFYKVAKKRYNNKRKEKFFRRMLRQQLSTDDIENTKLFTAKQLSKATDGFNENRILGQGGQGMVYKGMLNDGKIVAIKKAKNIDDSRFEEFVNEVVILSQVNHRNVVKLLGCCLQTEIPLLVYEFIPNGTLYSLIHNQNDDEFPFTWNLRLRIATEIAGALAYLHSQISVPILHRDVKSSNVLLDEKYIAKVADFGTSRSIEVDKTHLTTGVKGTFGYLDPEYFQTSQYTEKCDVYSFGVVLVELITRQKPISSIQTGGDRVGVSLVEIFLKSMNQNSLQMILDPQLTDESIQNEVIAAAKLARQCLNPTGKTRPSMKEILMELDSIKLSKGDSTIPANFESPSFIEELPVGVSNTYYTWISGSDTVESSSDAYPFLF